MIILFYKHTDTLRIQGKTKDAIQMYLWFQTILPWIPLVICAIFALINLWRQLGNRLCSTPSEEHENLANSTEV